MSFEQNILIFMYILFQKDRFELKLPSDLPPTHRGKIIRFSYKLVVGVQRPGMSRRSQIFQLPFKMFSRVGRKFDTLTLN